MLGPDGIEVLYGKEEILSNMDPFLTGGDMIQDVDFNGAIWNKLPWKFEAGTPNIVGGIAFGESIKYLNNIGMNEIEKYEKELIKYFYDKLNELNSDKIILIGPRGYERTATFSLYIKGRISHEIGKIMDMEGIAIRTSFHCAHPLLKIINIDGKPIFEMGGVAKPSLYIYNTKEEIDKFFEVLKKII